MSLLMDFYMQPGAFVHMSNGPHHVFCLWPP